MEITDETITDFKRVEAMRNIMLHDIKIAASGMIPDEVIEDMLIEVIRLELRRLTQIYISGVFRAELLQDESKVVTLVLDYPASLWDHFKYRINQRFGSHLKVKMDSLTQTSKVTFTRNAVYPHMPSLKKEYGTGRYVIKESFVVEEGRRRTWDTED